MNDGDLKAALKQREEACEGLLQTRASLGSLLAETIRRDKDLSEFGQHIRDLPLLIRSADVRRTELTVELLRRQLKVAEEEHRLATESSKRIAADLEKAKSAYVQAMNAERRSGLKARRLEELFQEEMARLEQLRSEEARQDEEEKQDFDEEQPGASETASEEPERVEPRSGTGGPHEGAEQVSWWRRVFGV